MIRANRFAGIALRIARATKIANRLLSEGREWGIGSVVVGSAFGAPQMFAPNRSETLQNEGFRASELKIGAPQKRRFNDHGSNAPFSAL